MAVVGKKQAGHKCAGDIRYTEKLFGCVCHQKTESKGKNRETAQILPIVIKPRKDQLAENQSNHGAKDEEAQYFQTYDSQTDRRVCKAGDDRQRDNT